MTEQENEKEEDLEEERKRIKDLGLKSTGWDMLISSKKNKEE
ncbi:MAG: hypothetical protein ACTSU4_04275 [Promethearchaeota archaeon]